MKMNSFSSATLPFFYLSFLLLTFHNAIANVLPPEEVLGLKKLASEFKITYWKNISPYSCIMGGLNINISTIAITNITCDCTLYNNSACHITNIQLKGLNLTGGFPQQLLTNFKYLEEIDLTRNYLSGPLPKTLFKLPLIKFAVLGNRFNGTIPAEFGNIVTLEELVLDNNQLGGTLPDTIGNLSNLRRLLLAANNFTGSIPHTYAKLANLSDFRIDGNRFDGAIPEFFGNWTKMDRMDIQGSSLSGPIPSSISNLKDLTQLRISDLTGPVMDFPKLENMKKLKELVLRNCQIRGKIPEYIGDIKDLKTLDLSFNNLEGELPQSFNNLTRLQYLFLSSNSLTGPVPDWVLNSRDHFDLSENKFTGDSTPLSCLYSDINLISSFTSPSSANLSWCFKKPMTCPSSQPKHDSLFINCGGPISYFEGNLYEEDSIGNGPSTFYSSLSQSWAYSSTGVFTGMEDNGYIARNGAGKDIYADARLAPTSLSYYGLCLKKGTYKVRLHFAETMFSDDQTFSSLGRRVFDVKIQGKIVLKDFNIAEEAKGVGMGISKDFSAIVGEDDPLKIQLYWAGKGTNALPTRGVYGPLISAISVIQSR